MYYDDMGHEGAMSVLAMAGASFSMGIAFGVWIGVLVAVISVPIFCAIWWWVRNEKMLRQDFTGDLGCMPILILRVFQLGCLILVIWGCLTIGL